MTSSTTTRPSAAGHVSAPSVPPLTMDRRLSFVLFGHAAFQYLSAACELGLVDLLAERGPLPEVEIREQLGLQERACAILLLGCTALGLTVKEGSHHRIADLLAASLRLAGTWQQISDTVAFEQEIVYEGQADFARIAAAEQQRRHAPHPRGSARPLPAAERQPAAGVGLLPLYEVLVRAGQHPSGPHTGSRAHASAARLRRR